MEVHRKSKGMSVGLVLHTDKKIPKIMYGNQGKELRGVK